MIYVASHKGRSDTTVDDLDHDLAGEKLDDLDHDMTDVLLATTSPWRDEKRLEHISFRSVYYNQEKMVNTNTLITQSNSTINSSSALCTNKL